MKLEKLIQVKDENMGKNKTKYEPYIRMILPKTTDKVGTVEKMLGNDRLLVRFPDGKQMIARIRGKMRKRVWIREGDVVLVSPWDFEPDKGDIFYRYTRDQVRELKKLGIQVYEKCREKEY
jgi:translation initiation factor 1A